MHDGVVARSACPGSIPGRVPAAVTREIWAELSASMRLLRHNAGMSLRQTEAATGRGRGSLSQIETGKSRPNRALVEWYDANLGGDGLLLSMFAEARTAHTSDAAPDDTTSPALVPTAAPTVEVLDGLLPIGVVLAAGRTIEAGWCIRNIGSERWRGCVVRRVGAHGSARLITSEAAVAIDDCAPGGCVDVRVRLRIPDVPGTFAAYWQVVDGAGVARTSTPSPLSVVIAAAAIGE